MRHARKRRFRQRFDRDVVHVGVSLCCFRLKDRMATLSAIAGRRHAEHGPENPVEGLQIGIAGSSCDRLDRKRRQDQIASRPMQAQALDGSGHRLAMHRPIHPVPVMRRQTGDLGDAVKIEVFVQMRVDIVRDAPEALFVLGPD